MKIYQNVRAIALESDQALNAGDFSTQQRHPRVFTAPNHERFVGNLPPVSLETFGLNFYKICFG